MVIWRRQNEVSAHRRGVRRSVSRLDLSSKVDWCIPYISPCHDNGRDVESESMHNLAEVLWLCLHSVIGQN